MSIRSALPLALARTSVNYGQSPNFRSLGFAACLSKNFYFDTPPPTKY